MSLAGCRSQSPTRSGRVCCHATPGIAVAPNREGAAGAAGMRSAPPFYGREIGSRVLAPLAFALIAAGCTRLPEWNPSTQMGNEHSIADGTQIAVPALPGWGGGCYWPFVNLWSGNLVLRQVLLEAPALGFDWDLVLYYNSTLAGTSTVLGPGWRHSYEMELQVDVPAPGQITVLWGDGRADVFTSDGGGWAAHPALQGRYITAIAGGYELKDKHGRRYEYDASGRLTRTIDRSGHATTFTYAAGQLQQVADPSGRTLDFVYDGFGRLERVQGLPPQPAQFQYDGASRLIRVVHPYVGDHVYSYDALDRLVRVEDADGRATQYGYWLNTQVTREARADGSVRRFDYDATQMRTTVTDSVDVATAPQTTYTFDAEARCTTVDGPLGVTNNTYTALHQVATTSDNDGHDVNYQYDGVGNLVKFQRATSQLEWTYDPVLNVPLTFTNELVKVWTFEYDANGNLTKVTDPLNNFRTYAYDGLDRRISRTDEDNRTTTYGYDAWSNVNQITDAAGGVIQLTRNVRGAVEQVTDQMGSVWQIPRGPKDEVTSVEPPGPLALYAFAYNAPGFVETVTDPAGAVVRYSYDGLNRMIRRDDPFGLPTTLERDGAGRVKSIVDASGAVETYTRDPGGRVTSMMDADGGLRTFFYSSLDLTEIIDPMGNHVRLTYDSDHRLVRVEWPGITEDYLYDLAGRLVRADRQAGAEPLIRELYTYDDANRRTSTHQVHLGRLVTCTYSAAGDALSVADNLQPLPLTIGYDPRHLPVSVAAGGVPAISAIRDPRRQVRRIAYSGSSLRSDYTYDAVGRLVTVVNQSGTFAANYDATYNLRGDREQVTGSSPTYGAYQHIVGFDPKRRMTVEQIVPGPPATTWSYDAVDDRAQTDPPLGPLYTYSTAHRLQSGDNLTQVWDANGNVTQMTQPTRTLTYTYGGDSRLTEISDGGQSWHFLYGPGGTLARVTLPGGAERWLVSDDGPRGPLRQVELPGPGLAPTLERVYAIQRGHGARSPVAEIRGAHVLANFRPLLSAYDGSIVGSAQADPGGTLESDRYFDRFGRPLWEGGAPQPDVGFQSMVTIAGLDSMPWRLHVMAPYLPGIQAPFWRPISAIIPGSGAIQSDRGFGSDALAERSANAIVPDPDPMAGIAYWFEWAARIWNYFRNRLIEEGYEGPIPPPIDWPPGPVAPFGPGLSWPSWGAVDIEPIPGGKIDVPDILIPLDPFPWVTDRDPWLDLYPWTTDFHPGIESPDQTRDCDCEPK